MGGEALVSGLVDPDVFKVRDGKLIGDGQRIPVHGTDGYVEILP